MEAEPYTWAWSSTREGSNLDLLLDIRRGVEELRKTAATFRISSIVDEHPKRVRDEMMWLQGSWEAPDHLATSSRRRWVNPSYVHRRKYADLSVECECGARVGPDLEKGGGHDESCTVEQRAEAMSRVHEKRRDWIETVARLGLYQEEASWRMGLSTRRFRASLKRMDYDWSEKRKEGLMRIAATAIVLHEEHGESYTDIAEAFRMNYRTLHYNVYRVRNHE